MGKPIDSMERRQPIGATFEAIDGNILQMVLRDTALKPGNLVHGVKALTRDDWKHLLQLGIQAPMFTRKESFTDNQICFAMLSENSLPDRYLYAMHEGPKTPLSINNSQELSVGIIVEGQDVIKAFPDQTFAVGRAFWHRRGNANIIGKEFSVDRENMQVYGIPLKPVHQDFYELHPSMQFFAQYVRYPEWEDEVKVVFPFQRAPEWVKEKYPKKEGVSPWSWRGLVVPDEKTLNTLLQWTIEDGLVDKIPPLLTTYTPNIDRVSTAFIDLKKK